MKQQLAAVAGEGQVAQLVQDHQLDASQPLCGASPLPRQLLLFEPVDQIQQVVEVDPVPISDRLAADGDGEVGLAGASAAHEDHIRVLGEEGAFTQGPEARLLLGQGTPVKAVHVLGDGESGLPHAIADTAGFAMGCLRQQQLMQDLLRGRPPLQPHRDDLIVSRQHPFELQLCQVGVDLLTKHESPPPAAGHSGCNRRSEGDGWSDAPGGARREAEAVAPVAERAG